MELSLLALLLVMAMAYANGTNDVSKAIATLVGSGVTDYRTAIIWGTVWTVAGAGLSAFVANAMLKTFSAGLIQSGITTPPALAPAILIGAMGWVFVASKTGLPVSTTHALTGALVGAGLIAIGSEGLAWTAIAGKIGLPLLMSPILAFAVSFLLHPLLKRVADRWEGTCLCVMPASRALVTIDARGNTRTLLQTSVLGQPVVAVPAQCERAGLQGLAVGLDSIHWLSSGVASLARGANDTPKIMAMLLLGSVSVSWPNGIPQFGTLAAVALAMGLGSYIGGYRVTEVLAEKITRMDHVEGLSANLTTSSLVLVSATMGLPVSTTHVSGSAIIGIGMRKGLGAVRWTTVLDMVLAWIVTLPAAAILAGLAYFVLAWLL